MKLDAGCGPKQIKGYVGLDKVDFAETTFRYIQAVWDRSHDDVYVFCDDKLEGSSDD